MLNRIMPGTLVDVFLTVNREPETCPLPDLAAESRISSLGRRGM